MQSEDRDQRGNDANQPADTFVFAKQPVPGSNESGVKRDLLRQDEPPAVVFQEIEGVPRQVERWAGDATSLMGHEDLLDRHTVYERFIQILAEECSGDDENE